MKRNYITSGLFYFLILILFFNNPEIIFSQGKYAIEIEDLREHMHSIASNATEGRLTGSL
jgi:hypothetical protein